MKRVMAVGLAAVLAATLAGCGKTGSGGSGDGKGDVTLWMYPVIADQAASHAFWDKVTKDFEAKNPGINVRVDLQPWDGRQEKITTALASGKGFDAVLLTPDQIPQYVQQGTLSPVDEVLEGSRDKFRKTALDVLTNKDKLYGVPIYQTATAPIYNKAAFARAGITELPQTWDEMKADAPRLAAQGIALLDYAGGTQMTLNQSFYPLLWEAGGSVFNADGTSITINDDAGVSALQFLLDLKAAGGLVPNAATKINQIEGSPIATGKAAMSLSQPASSAQQLAEAIGPDNVAVGKPLRGQKAVSYGIPGSLVLARKSANPVGTRKFLRYVSSPEVMTQLSKASGYFPTSTDATVPADLPYMKDYTAHLDYLYPGDVFPAARRVMAAVVTQIQAALTGKKTAKRALDDAAAEAKGYLG